MQSVKSSSCYFSVEEGPRASSYRLEEVPSSDPPLTFSLISFEQARQLKMTFTTRCYRIDFALSGPSRAVLWKNFPRPPHSNTPFPLGEKL